MARFWIGTSGYSYKQWKGHFYPEDIDDKQMLGYYGRRLDSVEINNTFYRFATVRQLQAWAGEVGDEFTFSLKAPRRITHQLKLRDAAEIAASFCDNCNTLGDKLGCVLFQLPPYLKLDLPRLEDFLHQIPPGFRIVFEFRSASWFADEVLDCLRRFAAALCQSDLEDLDVPSEPTARFAYFRLRRAEYDDRTLSEIAERIRSRADSLEEIFIYLKHESQGPSYAVRLRELLVS